MSSTSCVLILLGISLAGRAVAADVEPPNYFECRLDALYPAGGRQGQTVTVEFLGFGGGLAGARDVLIDGGGGITVREVKTLAAGKAQAVFEIAPDAPSGRRLVRVVNERTGLTNMAYFVVGRLPERLEQEKNDEPATAQEVSLPVVVNGRVDPKLDVDCYRFRAQAGQRIVLAALSHAFDCHGAFQQNTGFVDTALDVLDEQGRVVAEAGDTLGFDPVIELDVPRDGWYTARVQLPGYNGFPQAVYRLTLGEVPLVTSAFPPGGRCGSTVEVELSGPNVPPGTRQPIAVPAEPDRPLTHISLDGPTAGDHDLPFVFGDLPEQVEAEPNADRDTATPLAWPATVNGRFDAVGDEDWYRLTLKAQRPVLLEVIAQRHLRSPVDTVLEVLDATGQTVAANDDASEHDGESPHDFKTFDSELAFTPKADGDYFVRIREATGAAGPRAVYRLTARPAEPDFRLYQWPDAVPIWGPGTTAGLMVKVERLQFLPADVQVSIEGLPPGWTGSTNVSLANTSQRPVPRHGARVFLTITAPADAPVGTTVPFRVVGRAVHNGRELVHTAQPLTFYHSGDRGFYRVTPTARAAVAAPRGAWLETDVTELKAAPGATLEIPVRVVQGDGVDKLPVVVNLAMNGVKCNHGPPMTLPVRDGRVTVPLEVGDLPPGTHGLTVSRGWASDFRNGMPGPCTPLIRLHVEPPAK